MNVEGRPKNVENWITPDQLTALLLPHGPYEELRRHVEGSREGDRIVVLLRHTGTRLVTHRSLLTTDDARPDAGPTDTPTHTQERPTMPKPAVTITGPRDGKYVVETATDSITFDNRAAARAHAKQLKAVASSHDAEATTEPAPAEPVTTDTGAQEVPTTMANTITIALSGKVHTLLVKGQSEVGGKPGNLNFPESVIGWADRKANASLAPVILDAERSPRSKGYVAKVELTKGQARRLVEVLDRYVEALEGGAKNGAGGGFDASNCRRYCSQAIDKINDLAEAQGWRLGATEEAAA